MSPMSCLRFVKLAWADALANKGHDWRTLQSLSVIKAVPGYLEATLRIEKEHLNRHKTIHGGVLLSLTDTVTTLALNTHGLPSPTGVTTNLSCDFLRPGGKEGDILTCVGEVTKLGRTLAFTRVRFLDARKRIVATGSHTKAMGDIWQRSGHVKFDADGNEVSIDP